MYFICEIFVKVHFQKRRFFEKVLNKKQAKEEPMICF